MRQAQHVYNQTLMLPLMRVWTQRYGNESAAASENEHSLFGCK